MSTTVLAKLALVAPVGTSGMVAQRIVAILLTTLYPKELRDYT